MHYQMLMATTPLAATVHNSKHFHIGPWVIVPVLILIAVIGTPIYVMRDRHKRCSNPRAR